MICSPPTVNYRSTLRRASAHFPILAYALGPLLLRPTGALRFELLWCIKIIMHVLLTSYPPATTVLVSLTTRGVHLVVPQQYCTRGHWGGVDLF
jgi:hypothetical protein